MRQVNLDEHLYQITGEITRRNINPFKASIDMGIPGYSSFANCSVERWQGLRGGIGVKYQQGSGTEQLYWSEGVNTSLDKGIIQGPKINTAGTFGDDAYTAWAASHVYAKGIFIKASTYNNHIYECTTGGTSGGTEPETWGTTDGGTTEDGGAVWTCRSVQVVKIFDFNGGTYAIAQNMIAKWDSGNTEWDAEETGLATPIDAIVVTDETATYAVVSSATAAYYKATSDAATWGALTGCLGYMAAFDNKLVSFYGQTLYRSPKGNIDGTWTNFKLSAYLGTVNGLFAGKLLSTGEPTLYLNTTEGLWAIDYWTQEIYKQEISFPPNTYAGYTGMYWNSYVWIATGAGIKKISPGMSTDVGTDQDDGLPSGYQGCVWDMEGLADWLVYCVNGGSTQKSSIFKRHGTIGGNQQVYTTSAINKAIRCLHYSPSSQYTNGRLWWGEDIGIKYCMFPDFNADTSEISGYEFALTSGKAIFSTFRPLAAFTKLAIKVMAVTKGCSIGKKLTGTIGGTFTIGEVVVGGTSEATGTLTYAAAAYIVLDDVVGTFATGETATGADSEATCSSISAVGDANRKVSLYYKIDNDASWTDMGDFATSPTPTALTFASGAGTEFRTVTFGIEVTTDDAAVTVELKSLDFSYLPSTDRLRGWQFLVRATQHDAEAIFSSLQTSQDKKTLIKFYPSGDTNKSSYWVKITNLPETLHWDSNRREGEIAVSVEEIVPA